MSKSTLLRLIASGTLVIAFFVNLPMQLNLWDWIGENQKLTALFQVQAAYWLSDFFFVPQALFFSVVAVVASVVSLAFNKSWWLAVIGPVAFLAMLPLRFAAYASSIFANGDTDPFGTFLQWITPKSELMVLHYFSQVIALIAFVLVLLSKNSNVGHPKGFAPTAVANAQTPVAYDTQTGRPILRYDSRTGKPIYADEKPQG